MLTPMKEASKRLAKYKKKNPLTVNEILKMNLAEYYQDLQIKFYNEVMTERKIESLPKKITIDGFTFEKMDNEFYECRGAQYFDDEHDQVPEPSLQKAAVKLAAKLMEQGIETDIEHQEKGWIEVCFPL